MDIDLALSTVLPDGVSCWTGASLAALPSEAGTRLAALIDQLGAASAHAQAIPAAFTSASKLRAAADHRLYVLVRARCVVGMLKVGVKHLFYWSNTGATSELDPLCVLDFYVHESCQRAGLGRLLFDAMLAREGRAARACAYDRPSPKMLPFLARHFGLREYTPQPNNFVVFEAYFSGE